MKFRLLRFSFQFFTFLFSISSFTFSSVLRITFINVGQGDSALIETPSGQNILIDGGDKDQGTDTVIPLLRAKEIARIDKMIVSNNDSDHYSGFQDILNDATFTVGTFYHSETFSVISISATVTQAKSAGRVNQIVELTTNTTPTLDFGGSLTVNVLKSAFVTPGTADSRNANSNIIKITYNQTSFLFTGDSDDRALSNVILNRGSLLRSTIVKVPHHASANLPTPGATSSFVAVVKPEVAVVSVGGSSFGLPDSQALDIYTNSGARVLRTDRLGNISIVTNGVSYSISTSLSNSAVKGATAISNVHVYPNPVKNESGTVVYFLDGKADSVKVKIFTLSGELIQSLDGLANEGTNFIIWDGKNQDGAGMSSGLYVVTVEAKVGASSVFGKARFAFIRK